ncbi:MAG: hypothetical protein IPH06_13630 [Alphaproteobacteria bacterium]|nr:hypothetical protein [Alphaproteobacteria bacterium]
MCNPGPPAHPVGVGSESERNRILPALVQVGAFCCTLAPYTFPPDTRRLWPARNRPSVSRSPSMQGDYEALCKLAESQRPPLPLQYVVRLAVRRFLDQPEATVLRPAGDEAR